MPEAMSEREARPGNPPQTGGDSITVSVPATSANLGPGFDCLGLALDFGNRLTVSRSDSFSITCTGEGASSLPRTRENRVYQGIRAVFERLGRPLPRLSLHCENDVPLMRGLGSSAAAAVAGLVAGNLLCDRALDGEELLQMAAAIEGHADNVAPALFGGCQIVVNQEGRFRHAPVPLGVSFELVLFIPAFPMSTSEGRAILPRQVSRRDAIFNIARASLLVASLATGNLEHLDIATDDRLHQPARRALFPAMAGIIDAAKQSGARGAFLSGAGSTIAAVSTGQSEAIGRGMYAAAAGANVSGTIRIARPAQSGALQH